MDSILFGKMFKKNIMQYCLIDNFNDGSNTIDCENYI